MGATDGLVMLLWRCQYPSLQRMSHQADSGVGVVALVGQLIDINSIDAVNSTNKAWFKPDPVSSTRAQETRWESRLRWAHAFATYKGVPGALQLRSAASRTRVSASPLLQLLSTGSLQQTLQTKKPFLSWYVVVVCFLLLLAHSFLEQVSVGPVHRATWTHNTGLEYNSTV